MTTTVNNYLTEGCGRCSFGGTPQCKVHSWKQELEYLRKIVLDCGLNEEVKWGVPCYTYRGDNIVIVSAFKEYCALSFFKGSLLQDAAKIISQPGENSPAARLIKFTNLKSVVDLEPHLKNYIYEAIEIEKAKLKIEYKSVDAYEYPEELTSKFKEDTSFKSAFEALTPGRRKGYLLHFNSAKQSKTRSNRIEKARDKIFSGKGWNEY
ncbi:MAG: YdeI/OmpD-associated family protein [Bacteroidetes bacterium]|nr:YdeI/OmpD-associated family protein [Bacteroidota bacterium]